MKIVKFGRHNCPPCQQVEKFLKEKNINYESVDPTTTEDFDLLIEHNIKTVPVTLLMSDSGEVMTKVVGFSESALQYLINEYTNE